MVSEVIGILVLFFAGMFISTLGSMTGLGGGFLCVPFLVLAWGLGREEAVLTSLTMILANSASASISYVKDRMVDFVVTVMLAVTAIPALFLGYLLLKSMDAAIFDLLFALLLISVTTYILLTRSKKARTDREDEEFSKRRLVPYLSMPISFLAGIASSAFGIGGGAILMPLQVGLLKMSVKRAIATSMFLLMLLSGFRVFVISGGGFDILIALPLALGAVLGAQIGAVVVKKVKGQYLLYILAGFLFLIAIYMGGGALVEIF